MIKPAEILSLAWEGLKSHIKEGSEYKISAWEDLSNEEKEIFNYYNEHAKIESNDCN